ncbi:TetR/AcrR family transcriptional regulator [Paraburkholderia lacunae]|uniref:TetR/AcrR family transcriptional regulator n=1 Tax=Paraburkholderia lacunae TaxID=2211104 RepID=A0A370N0H2_9BURK|nr:TetR/AcrR family transcriptional regulator [Paraburkholderia lacunae]RDJ99054.1 TetR/AcrR family transcriptional regulator [Paraburkholderia lacunae]
MPNRKSSRRADDVETDGRANQKRRTRQALIDAALALRDEGRNPTFAEVAERALVSRATAYRYFSSVEALVSETATERGMLPLERFWRSGDNPAEGISRAAREMMKLLLDDEVGLHMMERSFMAVWLENDPSVRPPRPGRRMKYIEPIVESLKGELAPSARRRLAHALSMVMGSEAALAVRDIGGASVDEALTAAAWAAQALVSQACAETAEARRKRAAARTA